MSPSPKPTRNAVRSISAPYATRATRASSKTIINDNQDYSDVDGDDLEDARRMPQLPKMREVCTPEQKEILLEFFERTAGYPTKSEKAEISKKLNKSERSVSIWLQNQRHPRDKKKTPHFVLDRLQTTLKSNIKGARKTKSGRKSSITSIMTREDSSEAETAGSSAVAESRTSMSPEPVLLTSTAVVVPTDNGVPTNSVPIVVDEKEFAPVETGTTTSVAAPEIMKSASNSSPSRASSGPKPKESTPGPSRATRQSPAYHPYPTPSATTKSRAESSSTTIMTVTKPSTPIKSYTHWHTSSSPTTDIDEESSIEFQGRIIRPSELEVALVLIRVPEQWIGATHVEGKSIAC